MNATFRLAPGVPGLESLGSTDARDWLGDGSALETGDRIQVVSETAAEIVARIPLPGTPDAEGVQRETPRGAGTGWLVLRVFRGGGAALLRARLTQPRSTSLAARRWNLICHLQASGLGAPQLVAMGEAGSSESFVLERELEGFLPLPALIAADLPPARRRLILRSLGLSLAGLFRAGAWLPELRPEHIVVQPDEAGGTPDGSAHCAALEIENLQVEARTLRTLQLKRRRLPGVALAEFPRGRVLPTISRRRRRRLLDSLDVALPNTVTSLERRRVLAIALRA